MIKVYLVSKSLVKPEVKIKYVVFDNLQDMPGTLSGLFLS